MIKLGGKYMSSIFTGAFSVGVLSWLWAYLSSKLGLITWVGFIGCTSYYASGGEFKGLRKSLICNMSGVFWAMIIIKGSSFWNFSQAGAILTGVFSFVMCYQSRNKWLTFIPGSFMGACSTFGANAQYKLVIISLFLGALVGYFSDLGGRYIYKYFGK
ncbi:membrane protein [Clostridium sp. K25]|nr:membrane protein [Clostridium sp. K25]